MNTKNRLFQLYVSRDTKTRCSIIIFEKYFVGSPKHAKYHITVFQRFIDTQNKQRIGYVNEPVCRILYHDHFFNFFCGFYL